MMVTVTDSKIIVAGTLVVFVTNNSSLLQEWYKTPLCSHYNKIKRPYNGIEIRIKARVWRKYHTFRDLHEK